MSRTEMEQAASVWATMFRESARRDIQLLYTGRPSLYSNRAKTLAIAFFLVYVEASERLAALNDPEGIDASACWQIALQLTEARHD